MTQSPYFWAHEHGAPLRWTSLLFAAVTLAPFVLGVAPASAEPLVFGPEPAPERIEKQIRVVRIERDQALPTALSAMGLSASDVGAVMGALTGKVDFRRIRVGEQLRATSRGGALERLEYRGSRVDEWIVERNGERSREKVGAGFEAKKREVSVETRRELVTIPIESSLYVSMLDAGEDPVLAVDLADVFAWDIDFYRDVRAGDRMKVVVDKLFVDGEFFRYGDIQGARYDGELVGTKRLLRYQGADGKYGWYDEDGTSAQKVFLKTPLKFVHVTSKFGARRHPLLGYVKQHRGVDFAAMVGTPVWSVADGVVTRAVRGDPRAGNFLAIRHANGYETLYMHLSRFGEGVRNGAKVRQKQVVAYSGNTGASTGPHLHFELKKQGSHINPLTVKFPRAEPLPKAELPAFLASTEALRAQLNETLSAAN